MKQSNTLIIIGLIAAVIGTAAAKWAINKGGSSSSLTLEALASSLNTKTPMQVDQHTRWDSTAALPQNTLAYFYTVQGVDESKIDKDAVKNYLRPILTNTYKTNPDMQDLRSRKVNLRYTYRTQSGVHLFDLDVPFSDIAP